MGIGDGENLWGIKFKYDDQKLEQQFSSEHFTICKKYCDCRTWLAFHSSDFVPIITGTLSIIISI